MSSSENDMLKKSSGNNDPDKPMDEPSDPYAATLVNMGGFPKDQINTDDDPLLDMNVTKPVGFDDEEILDAGLSDFPDLDTNDQTNETDIVVSDEKKSAKTGKKKKPKKTSSNPWKISDWLIAILVLACFLGVIASNVCITLMGSVELSFYVGFNILGIVLLSVPILLFLKNRKEGSINFYDVMLGIALMLVVLACLILWSVQSVKYGTNIKGSLTTIAQQSAGNNS